MGLPKQVSLLAVVLFVQIACRYFGLKIATGVSFDWLTLTARLAALAFAVFALRFPLRELGFRWPKLARKDALATLGAVVVIAATLFAWKDNPSIRGYYRNPLIPGYSVNTWLAFVVSATVSWEVLHRGVLLFGLRRALKETSPKSAALFAGAIVCVFETLFHFTKPLSEAIGMMILSPVLSYLALRTGSLLLPLVLHVFVEAAFYAFTLS